MTHSVEDKIPQICGPFKFYFKLEDNSKTKLFFIFINRIICLLIFIP